MACISILFPVIAKPPISVWMCHFIYPFVSWWTSGWFPLLVLWIILLWICAQIFVSICVFISFRYIPGVEFLGHMVTLCWIFWEADRLFSKVTAYFPFLPAVVRILNFSTSLTVFLFDYSHPSGCEMSHYSDFDLPFPNGCWYWAFLCVIIDYLCF